MYTQGMNVAEQFKAGIHLWDICLRTNADVASVDCIGPDLWTFYGISFQFENFKANILPVLWDFLAAHLSKAALMHVTEKMAIMVIFATKGRRSDESISKSVLPRW